MTTNTDNRSDLPSAVWRIVRELEEEICELESMIPGDSYWDTTYEVEG
jgi:hypothetical protein